MSPVPDRLVAALADRYRVEHELGQGGMATVYLAEDLKHDRKVALKVLKPELAAVLGAERFVVEIKTTAALSHPHILPLFDSGTADGFLFYVMPYIQGETIREKLNRETQFGIDEAVKIASEVADALDYAHRHGVIHRDIKPENILLHDGRPMVMDFGIALAVSAAAGGRMTETGLSLGTPHYMSPEQATAEKEITPRSDVYSLASVLYEMLAGEPPHGGGSAQQIIMKIITVPAEPVTVHRKSVPPNVAAALATALEKLPADRFETAKAFADALADPHFTGATVVGGGAPVLISTWLRDPRSVAVSVTAFIAVAGLVWALGSRARGPLGPTTFDVGLPDAAPLALTDEQPFAVAPTGDFVIYHAQEKDGDALWYRSLRDATTRRIDGTEGGQRPAISADGTRIAFLRFRSPPRWTLEVVPIAGGATATLGDGIGESNLQWLDDGRIRVIAGDGNDARWFDPGGAAKTEQRTTHYCILPSSLPGRDQLLCGGGGNLWAMVADVRDSTATTGSIWTDAVDGTRVFGSDFHVVDGQYLVYLSIGGDLLAARVNVATGRVGRAVRLVTGIHRTAYFAAGSFAISRSGTLVYAEGPNHAVGNLVTTDGRSFDTLNVGREAFHLFALSPDERRLAAVVDGLQGAELRIYDVRTGESLVWARRPEVRQPLWSPRGDRLLFSWDDSVFVGGLDRSGAPELLTVTPSLFDGYSWTSEQQVFGTLRATSAAVSFDPTKHPVTWETLAADASFTVGSPSGRWLAYNSVDLTSLWLAPLPSTGQRYPVASGSVAEPQWLADRELTYLSYMESDAASLFRATIDTSGGVPVVSRRKWMDLPEFVETAGQSYHLTRAGRVLYVRGAKDEPRRYLRVVPDWVERMERAVDEAKQ